MKKDVDCLVFEDQLDSLVDGTLPEAGLAQLRRHALSCPDCSMLLRVKEHLALPPLEDLERAVPQDLLESIWPKVEEGLERTPGKVRIPSSPPSRLPWLIPSLAAASLALLLSTGFLFSALRQTAARGDELASQVRELQEGLEELGARTEWVERTARLAGSGRNRARALNFQFVGQEWISVGALMELIEGYPPETVLIDTSELRSLVGPNRRPPPELREILVLLEGVLSSQLEAREIRAGELAEWLRSAGISQDLTLPKASLIELLS